MTPQINPLKFSPSAATHFGLSPCTATSVSALGTHQTAMVHGLLRHLAPVVTNHQLYSTRWTREIFELVAKHSGHYIDVAARSDAEGANINQWTCHGGVNQQWKKEDGNVQCSGSACARCGDGVVSLGEECESGSCCDTATCSFIADSTSCGDDGFCQDGRCVIPSSGRPALRDVTRRALLRCSSRGPACGGRSGTEGQRWSRARHGSE